MSYLRGPLTREQIRLLKPDEPEAVVQKDLGNKKMSVTNVNRTRGSLSQASKLGKTKEDIQRAEDELASRMQQYQDLETKLEEDLEGIKQRYLPENLVVDERVLPFRKSDFRFSFFGLLWREI